LRCLAGRRDIRRSAGGGKKQREDSSSKAHRGSGADEADKKVSAATIGSESDWTLNAPPSIARRTVLMYYGCNTLGRKRGTCRG
jgi:hypothetical protein